MDDDLTPQEIDDLVDSLFTGKKPAYGQYTRVGPVEQLIRGRLISVLLHTGEQPTDLRTVTLFLNIHGAGGELWEHEVRSLLRLRVLGHPALPDVVDGRFDPTRKVAFIITRHEGNPLHQDWRSVVTEWAKEYPLVAFEQFSLLVDALNQLHGTRIMHRNLTLGAIRIKPVQGKPARASLALSRFELSTLLNSLIHSVHGPGDKAKYDEIVRALFLTPPPGVARSHHLAYLPPESHPSIFYDVRLRHLDHGSTDVFGLGVLGWELFVGAVVDTLPEECAAVERADHEDLPVALSDLHAAMRRHLRTTTKVPGPLRNALLGMLDPLPSERSSSFEASSALQRSWTEICTILDSSPVNARPKLLAFMPDKSVVTIYKLRNWIDHSPDTKQGCDELQAFLEEELREAELVHCQDGAVGFVKGEVKSLAEAKWVLIGQQAVWFCAYLYDETVMGRRTATYTDTLVIKYLTDKRFATEILSIRPKRRIGKVDLVPFRLGQPLDYARKDRPSWEEVTAAVATEPTEGDAEVQQMLRAMRFMLDYQGTAHRARSYPYVRQELEDGSVVLAHDHDRDRSWLNSDPLLAAYCSDHRRRPALGDFALELLSQDSTTSLSVTYDRPNPYFGADSVVVRLKRRIDADSIVVERGARQKQLPDRGWLRPHQDRGTETQLRRESRGLESLRQKPGLARTLHTPESIELRSRRETVLEIPLPEDAKPLRGRAPDIIADMLRLHPFYALQGPPGTGKSTVVAHALRNFLKTEHGARVLVSAQSNDALNQLGVKLVEVLKSAIDNQSILVLREVSRTMDHTDLPPGLRRSTAELITEDLVKRIHRQIDDGCQDARDPTEEKLMRQWAEVARENMVELTERVRAGADIVLATCSIAGSLTDEVWNPTDVFDWVIIEEAAKAWPTEVIMPMVLGLRWMLVGDHLQLGPHRAQDVEKFLDSLEPYQDERVALHYTARETYLGFVQLFGRFFREREGTRNTGPVDTLDTQYRMHPDIAQPFARTFYTTGTPRSRQAGDSLPPATIRDTFLKSDPEIDEVHTWSRPSYVKGVPLVWLDTSTRDDCDDTGYWWNRGEVDLVEGLVRDLGLADNDDPARLVVLTPYRRQVQELEHGFLKGRVHTVHSFQGGQAKAAIVSLVRSRERGTDFRQNVGHTAQAEVVNVMLSRAQQLLVVVGDLPHFERHGGPDWANVIAVFREVGRIVDAATGEVHE